MPQDDPFSYIRASIEAEEDTIDIETVAELLA